VGICPAYPDTKLVGGKPFVNSLVYRAQAVPYDWVPGGTPHSEKPVAEIDVTTFRVPQQTSGNGAIEAAPAGR
jgi:hypothetical protein